MHAQCVQTSMYVYCLMNCYIRIYNNNYVYIYAEREREWDAVEALFLRCLLGIFWICISNVGFTIMFIHLIEGLSLNNPSHIRKIVRVNIRCIPYSFFWKHINITVANIKFILCRTFSKACIPWNITLNNFRCEKSTVYSNWLSWIFVRRKIEWQHVQKPCGIS